MRVALRDIAESAESLVHLKPGDIVLDIGCNDGTLLRSYSASDLVTVGFEPADNLIPHAEVETSIIFNTFFSAEKFHARLGPQRAKVITTIAMLYDLDDPNEFTEDIESCLADDGIWIIQMAYLPTMLENNMFDNICHEHLEYYSLMSLEPILKRRDLEVCDVLLNDVNGGSFRIYVRHRGSHVGESEFARARVGSIRRLEEDLSLGSGEIYENFARRTGEICTELRSFIAGEVGRGKAVSVYGASTKGNTLLQMCGLDHSLIKAAAERNPDKWGKLTMGTNIPIVSEEEARGAAPDYFLILPWHFLREFREREAAFLAGGGKFIVPLPQPRLLGAGGSKPLA